MDGLSSYEKQKNNRYIDTITMHHNAATIIPYMHRTCHNSGFVNFTLKLRQLSVFESNRGQFAESTDKAL